MNTIPDKDAAATPQLIICGGEKPISFPIDRRITSLGRCEKNTIQIHRRSISAQHLEIHKLENGRHRIVDLGSRNGTRVNGISLGSCELSDGDCIDVGSQISIHFLEVAPAAADTANLPERDLKEFQSINEKLESLAEQQHLLQRRLREKTAQYEELLQSIVDLKQDPGKAFRKIYGEGEVHFPINFGDRITAPTDFLRGRYLENEDEVILSS